MGEFVGIDPPGAEKLISQMDVGKDILGRTRPGLEAAIAEAGEDWAGRAGVAAMHRTWWFFHESQQDLKWRIDTIRRIVPTQQKGMLTATFPFSSESESVHAARKDASAITAVLKRHDEHLSAQSWSEVEKALAAIKGKVDDPAYAAALMVALGPSTFQRLFGSWMNINAPGDRRGLTPDSLKRARESVLGLLAKAFASAESSGRLGKEWQEMAETAPAEVLTTLVAVAPQSGAFLNRVAASLLKRSPNSDRVPTDPNWNLYNLAKAYQVNPEAFQQFLAKNPNEAGVLLDAYTISSIGIPDYQQALADALHGALKPGSGPDGMREQAWLTVINRIGAENTLWVGGSLGTFADSPISRVLAQDIKPILDYLARSQAVRNSPEMSHLGPRPPWNNLDPTIAARFMGALMQDSAAADTLMKAAKEYTKELDIGRYHPFDPDTYKQAVHVNLAERTGALANLLLAGSTYAEWSDDEYAEWLADSLLMPVDYFDEYVPASGKIASVGKARGVDGIKGMLKGEITEFLDKKTPDTARSVARDLVNMQLDGLNRSLEEHRQPPLTPAQRAMVRDAMEGRIEDALIDALERRGG